MAAMAGALGVELEKSGHYRLGAGLRAPAAADVDRAVRVMLGAAALAAAIALLGARLAT
jgi:adenosylcobinamide-phosphate synthase